MESPDSYKSAQDIAEELFIDDGLGNKKDLSDTLTKRRDLSDLLEDIQTMTPDQILARVREWNGKQSAPREGAHENYSFDMSLLNLKEFTIKIFDSGRITISVSRI